MNNGDILQAITRSLSTPKTKGPGRTFLLTGPWGSGKTHLWKNLASKAIARPSIYVSAFGIDKSDNLKSRIVTQLILLAGDKAASSQGFDGNPLSKDRQGPLKAITRLLESTAWSYAQKLNVDPIDAIEAFGRETIICIDDIERASARTPIEEILGIINIISEHKGFDIVAICNEDQLDDDQTRKAKYEKYKEKVFQTTFQVSPELDGAYEAIILEHPNTADWKAALETRKSDILFHFRSGITTNLRALRRLLSNPGIQNIDALKLLTTPHIRFLSAATILATEASLPDVSFFEFTSIGLAVSEQFRSRNKEAPDPKEQGQIEFSKRFFPDCEYLFSRALYDSVIHNHLDLSSLKEEVSPSNNEPRIDQIFRMLGNGEWRHLSEQEIRHSLLELDKELAVLPEMEASKALSALTNIRFLASILDEDVLASTKNSIDKILDRQAAVADTSVDDRFELRFGGDTQIIRAELEGYKERLKAADIEAQKKSIKLVIESRSPDAFGRLIDKNNNSLEAFIRIDGFTLLREAMRENPRFYLASTIRIIAKLQHSMFKSTLALNYLQRVKATLEADLSRKDIDKLDVIRATSLLKRFTSDDD